jgi:tetratricopeptide (TPR) repeat protein
MDINEYRALRPSYNTLSDDYIIKSLEKQKGKPFADITYEDLGETNPNVSNVVTTEPPPEEVIIQDNKEDKSWIGEKIDAIKNFKIPMSFDPRGGGFRSPVTETKVKEFAPDKGAVRFVAKGATFAFSDNLEALIRSQVGDRDYDTVLKEIRAEMETFAKENPRTALAAEIAGGIITPGAITRTAFKHINKLPALARWVLKPLTISGQGALYGGGSSDRQNTIMNTAIGAVAAPAFYGGLKAVPAVGKFAYKQAKNLYGRATQNLPLSASEKTLGRLINEDVIGPKTILKNIKESKYLTLAESIGVNTVDMMRIIGKYPGQARKKIQDFLIKRNEDASKRVLDLTKKIFQIKGGYKDTYNTLIKKQKEISVKLYKPILGIPIRLDGELGDLLQNNPAMKEAYTAANKILRINPDFNVKLLDDMFVVDQNGVARLISNKLNVEKADIIKKGLDSILEKFRSKATGRLELKSMEAQNILKLQRRFLKLIDDQIPEYKAARAAWAGKAKQLEALELGKKFMLGGPRNDPDFFADRVGKFSADEQTAFVMGAAKQIELMVVNGINTTSVINKLLKTPQYKESLKLVFGNTPKGKKQLNAFMNFLKVEAKMAQTSSKVLGGSPTAETQAQMAFTDDTLKNIAYVGLGSSVARVLGAGSWLAKIGHHYDEGKAAYGVFKPSAPNRVEMANILMETNPAKIKVILDRALKGKLFLTEEVKQRLIQKLRRSNQLLGGISTVSSGEGRPGEIYDYTKRNLVNALRN